MLDIKPTEALDFSLPQCQDQLWGPSSLLGNWCWRLFPPGGGLGMKLTIHPHLVSRLSSILTSWHLQTLHLDLYSFSSTAQCSVVPNPSPNLTVIPETTIHDFATPVVSPRTPLIHLLFHSPSSCPSFPYFLYYLFWIPCDWEYR